MVTALNDIYCSLIVLCSVNNLSISFHIKLISDSLLDRRINCISNVIMKSRDLFFYQTEISYFMLLSQCVVFFFLFQVDSHQMLLNVSVYDF